MKINDLKKILGVIDLTNLDYNCEVDDIINLKKKALNPYKFVASCCVWPKFLSLLKKDLEFEGIKLCTVLNFPNGELKFKDIKSEIEMTINEGVDEIDFVIPYNSVLKNDFKPLEEIILSFKNCDIINKNNIYLKAIIETGELRSEKLISKTSSFLAKNNINFIKTSTGKVKINATPKSAEIILKIIKSLKKENIVGLKVSGGIKTINQAMIYMDLYKKILGQKCISKRFFRIGTSSLFDIVVNEIKILEENNRNPDDN